jgi:hypothetical protein
MIRSFADLVQKSAQLRSARVPWLWRAALALLIMALLLPAQVRAQSDAFQAEAEASYTFGQTMTFSLRAKSELPITAATLYFNTERMDSTFSVPFDVAAEREVVLVHEVSLTQVQLDPFATIRYWWEVESGGDTYMVAEQSFEYIDDRFDWHQLVRGDTAVYWTGAAANLGQVALDVVADVQPRLEAIFPETQPGFARIYIYPSTDYLRSALRLTGRDWLGADAMPELGVVLVTAVNARTAASDLGQSIPHELGHLMLYRATGAGYGDMPRWLEEGVATFFEKEPNPAYENAVQDAVTNEETIPFSQLCVEFPAEAARTQLAYAQSASLVSHIRSEYGNEALREMITAYADGADCDSGVRRSLGISLTSLEEGWRERLVPESTTARFWKREGIWLLLAGAGFAFMGLLLFPLRKAS